MTGPIPPAPPKANMRMSAEQLSAEAAQERVQKRKRYAAAGRKVVELGRERLRAIADEVRDVPTDMPASEGVKRAYETAFAHIRHEEWDQAREQLLELAVNALGWCARIDVFETRERGETE